MMFRLWPLTLLVTQIVLGYDHKIDLERCRKDTACFIRKTCFKTYSDPSTNPEFDDMKKELFEYSVEKLKDHDCDIILQMKLLTDSSLHVMIQVKLSGTETFTVENGIILFQKEYQFVCRPEVPITGSSKFKITPTGEPKYDLQYMFCSFIAEVTTEPKELYNAFYSVIETPQLIFKVDNDETRVTYPFAGNEMWNLPRKTCVRVTSSNKDHPTDKSLLLTKVETILDDLKCSVDRAGPQSFFVWKNSGPTSIETSKVKCFGKTWKYYKDGTMKELARSDEIQVYCSEKVCRKCAPPTQLRAKCIGCTPIDASPMPTDENLCPTLSCPYSKWTVDGKSIIDGFAECRRISENSTDFAWFVQDTELKEAACLEKIDCGARFKESPRYPNAPYNCPGKGCQVVGLGTNKLKCAVGHKLMLRDTVAGGGDVLVDEIECDPATGLFNGYKNATVECIPRTYSIRID